MGQRWPFWESSRTLMTPSFSLCTPDPSLITYQYMKNRSSRQEEKYVRPDLNTNAMVDPNDLRRSRFHYFTFKNCPNNNLCNIPYMCCLWGEIRKRTTTKNNDSNDTESTYCRINSIIMCDEITKRICKLISMLYVYRGALLFKIKIMCLHTCVELLLGESEVGMHGNSIGALISRNFTRQTKRPQDGTLGSMTPRVAIDVKPGANKHGKFMTRREHWSLPVSVERVCVLQVYGSNGNSTSLTSGSACAENHNSNGDMNLTRRWSVMACYLYVPAQDAGTSPCSLFSGLALSVRAALATGYVVLCPNKPP